MKIKRLSLFLLVGALVTVGPALAQEPPPQDSVRPINMPTIGLGEMYFRSSFAPDEAGPVELPETPDREAIIIRPLGGPSGGSVTPTAAMSAAEGRVPMGGGFLGATGAGAGSFSDPVRDTERRLKRLIRNLER